MQTNTLNTQQKKSPAALPITLTRVVAVSERGLSQGIVDETERALQDHELIKVKVFGIDRASRDEIASELAEKNVIHGAAKNRQGRRALPTQPKGQSKAFQCGQIPRAGGYLS